jgi:hypothetical protein
MNWKRILKHAPAFLIVVVSMIFSLVYTWLWIITFILVIIWFIYILLESRLTLIERIKPVIELLGKLSLIDSDSNRFISDVVQHPPKHLFPSPCWKKYFELKQRDVNKKFNEFNNKINTYRLLCISSFSIGKEFAELVGDTKILYEIFSDMQKCEGFNAPDCEIVRESYGTFIYALNDVWIKCPDIKNAVSKELLSPPLLPGRVIYGI